MTGWSDLDVTLLKYGKIKYSKFCVSSFLSRGCGRLESKFWRFEALLTRLSLVQWDGTDQSISSVLQRKKNTYKHRKIKNPVTEETLIGFVLRRLKKRLRQIIERIQGRLWNEIIIKIRNSRPQKYSRDLLMKTTFSTGLYFFPLNPAIPGVFWGDTDPENTF